MFQPRFVLLIQNADCTFLSADRRVCAVFNCPSERRAVQHTV